MTTAMLKELGLLLAAVGEVCKKEEIPPNVAVHFYSRIVAELQAKGVPTTRALELAQMARDVVEPIIKMVR